MNRTIKFRAFSSRSGMWSWEKLREGHPLGCLYSHEGWWVMQFTGIYDNRHTEIYEGDICLVINADFLTNEREGFSGVVRYIESSFYVDNGKEEALPLFSEEYEWVVIGNIHQNPAHYNQYKS